MGKWNMTSYFPPWYHWGILSCWVPKLLLTSAVVLGAVIPVFNVGSLAIDFIFRTSVTLSMVLGKVLLHKVTCKNTFIHRHCNTTNYSMLQRGKFYQNISKSKTLLQNNSLYSKYVLHLEMLFNILLGSWNLSSRNLLWYPLIYTFFQK